MPFVKVDPADLVIGKDYVLTHIGCASRMAGEQTVKTIPKRYVRSDDNPVFVKGEEEVVPECTILDDIPPSSRVKLEMAYKSWKTIQAEMGPPEFFYSPVFSMLQKKKKRLNAITDEKEFLKRGFYAGVNLRGEHVFSQIRGFGSKGAKFVEINVKEQEIPHWADRRPNIKFHPKYEGLDIGPGKNWVVWEERNNAFVGPVLEKPDTVRNNYPKPNVPKGNLLGLNNKPRMSNAKNNTLKARNNWLKQENRAGELKGLFGGSRTRRNKRY